MSKVLQRKLFKKKYVQGFQAGGIVTLKKGGEANYFEDVPAGRFLKSAGQSLVKEGKKAGAALYDLGAAPINLGMEFLTGSSPGYSGAKFFNVEGADPNKAYFMGVGTDATPKSLSEEKQKQAMRADTEVSGIEKQIKKDPTIRAKLVKQSDSQIATGNSEADKILTNYMQTIKPTSTTGTTGTTQKTVVDETPKDAGEVSLKKQLTGIMDQLKDERKEGYPVNVPLMKLALGLMRGTSYQTGLPGFAEIFGKAGEGALDAFIAEEKQKQNADLGLMELATKLKISQDEVAARKYQVDKTVEASILKSIDPAKQKESLSKQVTLGQLKSKILQTMGIAGKAGGLSTFDKIGGDLLTGLEAITGSPGGTLPSQQLKLLVNELKVALAKELTRGLSPISDRDIKRIESILASFTYLESPAEFQKKLNSMLSLVNTQIELEKGMFSYQNPTSNSAGFTNRDNLSYDQLMEMKRTQKS